MTDVADAYCATTDLRTGDIALPAYLGTKEQRVTGAAEEIDAAIGHIYVTPIIFPKSGGEVTQASRPSYLYLKKINWLLASARIILEMSTTGELQVQHAQGMGMLKEARMMLDALVKQADPVVLEGAPTIDKSTDLVDTEFTGPIVQNEDPLSLMEGFYNPLARARTVYGQQVLPKPYTGLL